MLIRQRTGLLAVAASFALAMPAHGDSSSLAKPAYTLLVLDGSISRWPKAAPGQPVLISYALADRALKFPQSRNCRAIQPIALILERSRIADVTFQSELREAFRLWERAANIRFVSAADIGRANIIIGAQSEPSGYAFTDVALTQPNADAARHIQRALICLNPTRHWKVGFDGNKKIYDLRYTLAHEIGHAIGLDHPGIKGQLMDFRYSEKFREPQAGDVAGATALYGAASSTHAHANHDTSDVSVGTLSDAESAERRLSKSLALGTPGAD